MMDFIFFNNGNTACFDGLGEQVGELQIGWLEIFFEFLVSKGINPIEHRFKIPNGVDIKVFETEYGYNWGTE